MEDNARGRRFCLQCLSLISCSAFHSDRGGWPASRPDQRLHLVTSPLKLIALRVTKITEVIVSNNGCVATHSLPFIGLLLLCHTSERVLDAYFKALRRLLISCQRKIPTNVPPSLVRVKIFFEIVIWMLFLLQRHASRYTDSHNRKIRCCV